MSTHTIRSVDIVTCHFVTLQFKSTDFCIFFKKFTRLPEEAKIMKINKIKAKRKMQYSNKFDGFSSLSNGAATILSEYKF